MEVLYECDVCNHSLCLVNCGRPSSPNHGTVGNYAHTREDATVTFQCDDGFRPSIVMTSICRDTAKWMPPPEELNCTLVIGE